MQSLSTPDRGTAPDGAAAWGAVLAMSLGAFALVASEFMPVSLLTPPRALVVDARATTPPRLFYKRRATSPSGCARPFAASG